MKLSACFSLLALMVLPLALLADPIYKGKDANGKTIFSDQPFAGSEQIEVTAPQTYNPPPVTTPLEPRTVIKKVSYEVTIVAPQPDQTFTTDINSIEVKVSVTPALQAGDKIQLLLNGQPYGTASEATTFTLQSLFRGAYRVQAQVYTAQNPNQPVAQSNEVTFYQKRAMIQ